MTDEKKAAEIRDIPVEDFGLGVVKLISQGLSGVAGVNAGEAGKLLKSLGSRAADMIKKVESGFACGTEKKTD